MDRDKTLQFVNALLGAKADAAAFEQHAADKKKLVDGLRADLDGEKKEELRKGFTFQVKRDGPLGGVEKSSFDERGSEHEVDTFGATRKGLAIKDKQYRPVHVAMTELLRITKKALAAVDATGQPVLRTPQEVMDEVFTPLVRERVLPENFVPDENSEVKRLLTATFKGYRERLQDEQENKAMAAAKATMDVEGAGSALDRLSGLSDVVKGTLNDLISEDAQRVTGIVVAGLKAGGAIGMAGYRIEKAADGSLEDKMKRTLAAERPNLTAEEKGKMVYGDEKYAELLKMKADEVPSSDQAAWDLVHGSAKWTDDPDLLRTAMVQAKRASKLRSALGDNGLADVLVFAADDIKDSSGVFYTKSGLAMTKTLGSGALGAAKGAWDIHKKDQLLDQTQHEDVARRLAVAAVGAIGNALVAAVARESPHLGGALAGFYEKAIDRQKLQEVTAPDTDGIAIVKILAAGFPRALAAACPRSADQSAFRKVGQEIASRFTKAAPGKALGDAIRADPGGDPFHGVVAVVDGCVAGSLTPALLQEVEANKGVILAQSVFPEDAELEEELAAADDELRAYENQLVLIDEGGVTAAEQRSIEVLIAQIQKDRKIVSLVHTLAGSLESLTGSSLGVAGWATVKITDNLIGQVMGPLKAAKQVMELAFRLKQAADRHVLLDKFKRNLERSRAAVSSLSSTIQGFLNNKTEQVVFRDLEIALQTVEIAATILGSIPEPFTLALGKTLNAVNAAAQQTAKVTEMIFNEVKLRQAWKTTKAAMQNPKDRALGLKALKLNPTLGMHAIAWAGMELQPPDPIARMMMGSVGLDEGTLAASGTERKVREYLETLLDEDRKLLDATKLQADWVPRSLGLTAASWCTVTARACREAVPALQKGGDVAVLAALKKVGARDPKVLEQAVERRDADRALADGIDEVRELQSALSGYTPKSSDGSDHEEMAGVVDRFAALAAERLAMLRQLAQKNMTAQAAAERDLGGFLTALRSLGTEGAAKRLTLDQRREAVGQIAVEVDRIGGARQWEGNAVVQTKLAECHRMIGELRRGAPDPTFRSAN